MKPNLSWEKAKWVSNIIAVNNIRNTITATQGSAFTFYTEGTKRKRRIKGGLWVENLSLSLFVVVLIDRQNEWTFKNKTYTTTTENKGGASSKAQTKSQHHDMAEGNKNSHRILVFPHILAGRIHRRAGSCVIRHWWNPYNTPITWTSHRLSGSDPFDRSGRDQWRKR